MVWFFLELFIIRTIVNTTVSNLSPNTLAHLPESHAQTSGAIFRIQEIHSDTVSKI